MIKFTILPVLFAVFCVVNAQQGPCTTASGGQGQCKSIYNCQPLLDIVNKANRTPQDMDLLKKSHCGFDGQAPAVCCPANNEPQKPSNECFTPAGEPGQCVNLYTCPAIANLLKPPVSSNIVTFVQQSRCSGPDQYSVCCGPVPDFNNVEKGNCASRVTEFPPDPRTECCGLDGSTKNKIVVNGQNAICRAVRGGQGQCISLYNCEELLTVAKKMLPQDLNLLRRSDCGRVDGAPAVCCPLQKATPTPPPPPPPPPSTRPPTPPPKGQCTTPDYNTGQCINIYSCPPLVNILMQSSSQQNVEYVQKSRCNGPDAFSVCCPSSTTNKVKPKNQCPATISAIPPDYWSGCCGQDSSTSNKIFGGEEASIDQFPWLVLIEYTKLGDIKTSCGGSLISGRYVLTAAHCLVGPILKLSGRPTRVRLGEYDKTHEGPDCMPVEAGGEDCTEGVVSIPIEKTIPHPEYNINGKWHDIGLIRLNRLAPYTDFIRPICLPKSDITRTISAAENLTTAGWGNINHKETSPVKLYVDLPFVSQDKCQPAYNVFKQRELLSSNQFCAGGVKGKDSCKGDSGGPLMYEQNRRYEVVGIVSFGHTPCGIENIPGVYTHVYQYDSWIRSNISP